MKSYTKLRTDYGIATLDQSATNLTTGTSWMNDELRRICALGDFPFMHKDRTLTTTAGTQTYNLPYDLESVSTIKVVVGTTTYSPEPINSQREWDSLNMSVMTSDAVQNYFVKDGAVSLWPKPATSSNTITLNGKLKMRDLNTDDITSTTITTLAAGGTALTVSGGLTVQMAGFWIQPTFSTTANTGDGQWYEIASVTNATTATLSRKYGGLAISAGTAACTIGQMPIIPDAFHDWPVFRAAETYWGLSGNANKYTIYHDKAEAKQKEFNANYKTNINDPVIDDGDEDCDEFYNANLSPTGMT